MDISAHISVEQVIASYANERDDYDPNHLKRYERIIVEGYSDLNMNHVITPLFVRGFVSDVNVFKLPADFVDYLRIGVVNNGKVWTLSENTNIDLSAEDVCGVEVNNNPTMSDWYTPGGGDNIAKYRIDKSPGVRRIVFEGPMMGREIVLEYISTGIPVSGNLYIPRGLMPVLKNYLDWTIKKNNDAMPENKVFRAKQDFYESLHAYERAEESMTADEILDIIRSGYTIGPKR